MQRRTFIKAGAAALIAPLAQGSDDALMEPCLQAIRNYDFETFRDAFNKAAAHDRNFVNHVRHSEGYDISLLSCAMDRHSEMLPAVAGKDAPNEAVWKSIADEGQRRAGQALRIMDLLIENGADLTARHRYTGDAARINSLDLAIWNLDMEAIQKLLGREPALSPTIKGMGAVYKSRAEDARAHEAQNSHNPHADMRAASYALRKSLSAYDEVLPYVEARFTAVCDEAKKKITSAKSPYKQ